MCNMKMAVRKLLEGSKRTVRVQIRDRCVVCR